MQASKLQTHKDLEQMSPKKFVHEDLEYATQA
jgi:hypothetical protein